MGRQGSKAHNPLPHYIPIALPPDDRNNFFFSVKMTSLSLPLLEVVALKVALIPWRYKVTLALPPGGNILLRA